VSWARRSEVRGMAGATRMAASSEVEGLPGAHDNRDYFVNPHKSGLLFQNCR
jgi:hypothetical protein